MHLGQQTRLVVQVFRCYSLMSLSIFDVAVLFRVTGDFPLFRCELCEEVPPSAAAV